MSHSALGPLAAKISYRHPLSKSDEEALLALPHRVMAFDPGHLIVRERGLATHCCLMLSGFSIGHKIVVGGARQIVAIQMKGDLVNLQNSLLATADHSVQMLTRGELAMIPREAIEQLALERPRVGMALWQETLVDGSISREWTANVGRRSAYVRLAHFLCEFALRLRVAGAGERTNYQLPMTQEQLADVVGLTPVHVNRTLKALETEKLISRSGKRSIKIEDWERMVDQGDFDPTYLHLPTAVDG